jgi:hypothetical protein
LTTIYIDLGSTFGVNGLEQAGTLTHLQRAVARSQEQLRKRSEDRIKCTEQQVALAKRKGSEYTVSASLMPAHTARDTNGSVRFGGLGCAIVEESDGEGSDSASNTSSYPDSDSDENMWDRADLASPLALSSSSSYSSCVVVEEDAALGCSRSRKNSKERANGNINSNSSLLSASLSAHEGYSKSGNTRIENGKLHLFEPVRKHSKLLSRGTADVAVDSMGPLLTAQAARRTSKQSSGSLLPEPVRRKAAVSPYSAPRGLAVGMQMAGSKATARGPSILSGLSGRRESKLQLLQSSS